MATEQKVEQVWETPSQEEIPNITKMHVSALETTDDDAVWVQAGMHHVLRAHDRAASPATSTRSRCRSGVDPDGVRTVVASFAGAAKHPAWFLNLADRDANPEVLVRVQGGEYWSVPDILETATSTPESGRCSPRTGPGTTTTRPRPSARSRWCACPRPARSEPGSGPPRRAAQASRGGRTSTPGLRSCQHRGARRADGGVGATHRVAAVEHEEGHAGDARAVGRRPRRPGRPRHRHPRPAPRPPRRVEPGLDVRRSSSVGHDGRAPRCSTPEGAVGDLGLYAPTAAEVDHPVGVERVARGERGPTADRSRRGGPWRTRSMVWAGSTDMPYLRGELLGVVGRPAPPARSGRARSCAR